MHAGVGAFAPAMLPRALGHFARTLKKGGGRVSHKTPYKWEVEPRTLSLKAILTKGPLDP